MSASIRDGDAVLLPLDLGRWMSAADDDFAAAARESPALGCSGTVSRDPRYLPCRRDLRQDQEVSSRRAGGWLKNEWLKHLSLRLLVFLKGFRRRWGMVGAPCPWGV